MDGSSDEEQSHCSSVAGRSFWMSQVTVCAALIKSPGGGNPEEDAVVFIDRDNHSKVVEG